MSTLTDAFQYLLNLGPSVAMPVIIFALGMLLRMSFGSALRSGLMIGIGFVAISLVVGLIFGSLVPAAQLMVTNVGINLDVIDTGGATAGAIALTSTQVVPWMFALGIPMNLGLIAVNFTRTLDVDLWNYWHFVFTAALVLLLSDSLWLAVAVGLISEVIALKLADTTAPLIGDFYGIRGVSVPHGSTIIWAPMGWLLNEIIDRIPKLNKVQVKQLDIQEQLGVFGEPMTIGSVLGLGIGVVAYSPQFGGDFGTALGKILTLSITLGAAMLLLPRMVAILIDGLAPLTEAAQRFTTQRFPGRELYIGMDAAIVMGFSNNITVGLIMVPITIALAVGMAKVGLNRMLPLADLATMPVYAIWASTWSRGNIVRGVIINSIFMIFILPMASIIAEPQTRLAQVSRFLMPPHAPLISSIDSGAHLVVFVLGFPLLMGNLAQNGGPLLIWSSFIVATTVVSYIVYFVYIARGHVPGLEDKALYAPKVRTAAAVVPAPTPVYARAPAAQEEM